jgi:excinuclease UvrABC nuclease subunit
VFLVCFLKKQMRLAAENLDFEAAAALRDKIRGLG